MSSDKSHPSATSTTTASSVPKTQLRELRRLFGVTQKEVADRTGLRQQQIASYESKSTKGRRFPCHKNLDALASFFEVSIDELIHGPRMETIQRVEYDRSKRDAKPPRWSASKINMDLTEDEAMLVMQARKLPSERQEEFFRCASKLLNDLRG
jgi:transcriptional regulator with XRE-family HTH domain